MDFNYPRLIDIYRNPVPYIAGYLTTVFWMEIMKKSCPYEASMGLVLNTTIYYLKTLDHRRVFRFFIFQSLCNMIALSWQNTLTNQLISFICVFNCKDVSFYMEVLIIRRVVADHLELLNEIVFIYFAALEITIHCYSIFLDWHLVDICLLGILYFPLHGWYMEKITKTCVIGTSILVFLWIYLRYRFTRDNPPRIRPFPALLEAF